jgi:Inorganic pyrophosphatase
METLERPMATEENLSRAAQRSKHVLSNRGLQFLLTLYGIERRATVLPNIPVGGFAKCSRTRGTESVFPWGCFRQIEADEPAFAGCVLMCRPIGIIEGEQHDGKKKTERNDRIVAIQKDAHSWADIKIIDDLGKQFLKEIEEFFVNYHKLSGKEYRILGVKGPDQARKLVKSMLQ